MDQVIQWSEIIAECGGYRQGFVAVFRRYEGQVTDEKDAQGRGVKVTMASFARHVGIPETTFKGWVKQDSGARRPGTPRDESGARKILRDAPMERVEQIISELPKDRQRAVAAAAGNEYLKARQEYDQEEEQRTPVERQNVRAAKEALTESGKRATASFLSLGIAGHIEQATEELRELVADGSVTAATVEPIERAFSEFVEEYQVARAMAGLEADLEGVR